MTVELWGGVLEIMYSCDESENLPDSIKKLRQKLQLLEESKNLEELRFNFKFTKKERNYLNSPLLDEILMVILNKKHLTFANVGKIILRIKNILCKDILHTL